MNKRRRYKAKRRRRDQWISQIAGASGISWRFWEIIEARQPSWYTPEYRRIRAQEEAFWE